MWLATRGSIELVSIRNAVDVALAMRGTAQAPTRIWFTLYGRTRSRQKSRNGIVFGVRRWFIFLLCRCETAHHPPNAIYIVFIYFSRDRDLFFPLVSTDFHRVSLHSIRSVDDALAAKWAKIVEVRRELKPIKEDNKNTFNEIAKTIRR